jgi:hypothetical protein
VVKVVPPPPPKLPRRADADADADAGAGGPAAGPNDVPAATSIDQPFASNGWPASSPASPTVLPATPAAPLSQDIGDAGQRRGRSGVHARIAQMGKTSAAAVQAQVEKFISNANVQAVGDPLVDATRAGVDLAALGADFVLSNVGSAVDATAHAIVAGGEKLDELAAEGRKKMQVAIDDLRARSTSLAAEAEKLLENADALDEQRRTEAQQMWAAGNMLGATAARLEELIHLDEAKAFLAYGGSALFKVTSDVFEMVCEVIHKGAKALAAGISMAGRFLKWLAGKDTLRSTAITVFGGVRMNLASEKLNAGVGAGLYFPSFKQKDESGKDSYFDVLALDWGASACSPIAGAGWNSRGGAGAGVNLYFISATFNSTTERVFIGVPGVWGVTLGRDTERGSEINFGSAVGLAGGPALGAYAGYGVSLHTPLLDPVNKYVTRPIAKVIVDISRGVADTARKVFAHVKNERSLT